MIIELLASPAGHDGGDPQTPGPAGPGARISGSGPLVDVCDEARVAVDFSCRAASCGTCRVEVLAGADLFEPPGDDERETLLRLGSPLAPPADGPPRHRLACQAVVRPGPGLLRLRWLGR